MTKMPKHSESPRSNLKAPNARRSNGSPLRKDESSTNYKCLLVEDTPTPTKFFQIGSPAGWINPFLFQNAMNLTAPIASPQIGGNSSGGIMLLTPGGGLSQFVLSPGAGFTTTQNPFFAQGVIPMQFAPSQTTDGTSPQYIALSPPTPETMKFFQMQPSYPSVIPITTSVKKMTNDERIPEVISIKAEDDDNKLTIDEEPGHNDVTNITLQTAETEPNESVDDSNDDGDVSMIDSTSGSTTTTTAERTTRPIIESDDPVISDKRRRNRIAAEKCRMRRKARQVNLEEINRNLTEQVNNLSKRLVQLNEDSQREVQELNLKNRSLKNENQLLRGQLAGTAAFYMANREVKQALVVNRQNK